MEKSPYINKLYRTATTAGLMTVLALSSMGCHFDGFSVGLFSYKRKPIPIRTGVSERLYRKPYIVNDFTCDASKERELIKLVTGEREKNIPQHFSNLEEEQKRRLFEEEYGSIINSVNQSNPIEGIKSYFKNNDNLEGSISFKF